MLYKVNTPIYPQKEWNGEYLFISSYPVHEYEARTYHATRKYVVHAIYKYNTYFLGQYFKLKDARQKVKEYLQQI